MTEHVVASPDTSTANIPAAASPPIDATWTTTSRTIPRTGHRAHQHRQPRPEVPAASSVDGMRGWRVVQYEDGSIVWTTPSGYTYLVEPPPAAEIRAPLPCEGDDEPAPF